MTFLEKNSDIVSRLSSKHRLDKALIEDMILHTFSSIKECMSMEEMPNILLHNWGRFTPKLTYIEKKLLGYSLHLKKGGILNENKYLRLKAFLNAYARLCIEENKTPVDFNYLEEQIEIYNARKESKE